MKISELLLPEVMVMNMTASTKIEALNELAGRLNDAGRLADLELFKAKLLEREAQSSTGIGEGVAMPHAKTSAVTQPTVVFGKSESGIEFESLDGAPAELFFMIAAPADGADVHLQTIAALSRLLIDADFMAQLKATTTPAEVIALFDAKQAETAATDEGVPTTSSTKFVVAVTACPNGIAHTYMSEDALLKKGAELGIGIRVETNGSEGAKNVLTAAEIARADGVIIAADKKVEMDRFDGKPLLKRPVTDGFRKSEELVTRASVGDAPIFHGSGSTESNNSKENDESIGSRIYKDLMNGISHMLPFVIGGGILLALSFIFENNFGTDNTIYKLLSTISGGEKGAFLFLMPILAGFIAMSIADRPGLMPGMVGGLMAVHANAGFLGALAAGFLAGYIVLGLRKVFAQLPKILAGIKPMLLYPIFGLLLTGAVMFYVFDPVFGWLNDILTTGLNSMGTGNAIILGVVLGGMMAIDMGGPFNKVAYAFSIGVFTTSGNTNGLMMAAVMAGGMVPPFATALASTFFKNKFTAEERNAGISNYVLGATFITEGAIPFAAADPIRIIVSSVIGAAIAGGLTQLWAINFPAPHGGFILAALANHPWLFVLAVAIGSVVAAIIMGLWKKPLK
ncbi:PTS fructose transporter subunit IIABC [Brochothrix campestris]|uniref:PTS system fructose-specific transporter subunit IIBC n=1 Tax=Brochothrix campestris FSL F6-1037 TaxID=1265861 RepID=W7CKD4_9LIST|nr:fructose-specific PTS transporter subunit EIIC [Brochothrix campestris]EUJ39879.1 PTS system fructose-specific transporter subunit IIBC [Brochothrix campestris FSL F6-1037]